MGDRAPERDLLVDIITADEPVEPLPFALNANFLGESLDSVAAFVEIENVESGKIDVGGPEGRKVPEGGDGNDVESVPPPGGFRRNAPVLHVLDQRLTGRAARLPVKRARRIELHLVGETGARADRIKNSPRDASMQYYWIAAALILLPVIADDADIEIFRGREQQLPLQGIAVPVVIFVVEEGILDGAVAPVIESAEASGEPVLDNGAGDRTAHVHMVEIAVGGLRIAAEVEIRPGGDDVDRAGGGVAPEQRALRPAQHFQPLHVEQFGQRRPRARAVDAVDKHAHRRFEGGVVALGADAANADHQPLGFGTVGGGLEAGRNAHHFLDIVHPCFLELVGAEGRHGQRHIQDALCPPRGGDDDDVIIVLRDSGDDQCPHADARQCQGGHTPILELEHGRFLLLLQLNATDAAEPGRGARGIVR